MTFLSKLTSLRTMETQYTTIKLNKEICNKMRKKKCFSSNCTCVIDEY